MNNQEQPEYKLGEIHVEQLYENDFFSVARVRIKGNNVEAQHTESVAVYVVEEGSGRFVVGGIPRLVKKGDVIYIPVGIPYANQGEFSLLAYNFPPFNKDSVILYPLNDEF